MNRVDHYDALVIGAGQAGVPLVKCLAVEAKLRTALIERSHVGGTCINEGCTPTKTMIASAKVAYLARRAAEFGVRTGPVDVDLAAVRRRTREIVEITAILREDGIEVLPEAKALRVEPDGRGIRLTVGTPQGD